MDRRTFIKIAGGTALGVSFPLALITNSQAGSVVTPAKAGLYTSLYVTHLVLLKKGDINYITAPFKATLQTNVWQAQLEAMAPNGRDSQQAKGTFIIHAYIHAYQQYLGPNRPPMADTYSPDGDLFEQNKDLFASAPENLWAIDTLSCFDVVNNRFIYVSPDGTTLPLA